VGSEGHIRRLGRRPTRACAAVPRDITFRLSRGSRTPTPAGARHSAHQPPRVRTAPARLCAGHYARRLPLSRDKWAGGISRMTARDAGTTASALPGIDQGVMPADSGGAEPGLGPARAIPGCARSFGSRRVVQRGDQPQPTPQCGHARTSVPAARRMKAAQHQSRQLLFTFVPSEPAACGVKAVGSRRWPTRRSHRSSGHLEAWAWEVGPFFAGVGADAPEAELMRTSPKHPVFRTVRSG
jgi:hypothetical protein